MCNAILYFFSCQDDSCESGVGSTKKEGNKWGKGKRANLNGRHEERR
jgi:hypothetical protein